MRFFKRKKKKSGSVNEDVSHQEPAVRRRALPEADLEGFVPPELHTPVQRNEIKGSDIIALQSLQKQFMKTGIIKESTGFESSDNFSELEEIIIEANNNSLTEKDFNSEFYDEETEFYLETDQEIQSRAGWENELIDGLDDSEELGYNNSWNKRVV